MAELTPVDWEVRGRPDATMCAYGQTLPQTGGCQQRVRRPPAVTLRDRGVWKELGLLHGPGPGGAPGDSRRTSSPAAMHRPSQGGHSGSMGSDNETEVRARYMEALSQTPALALDRRVRDAWIARAQTSLPEETGPGKPPCGPWPPQPSVRQWTHVSGLPQWTCR